jgi:TonB family protein
VEPQYTAEARAASLQGIVSLYVEVDRDGRPSQVSVMEGLGLGLDEQAVKAVQAWGFEPAPSAKGEIQDALEIDVPFRLDPPGPWSVQSAYYQVTVPDSERKGEIVQPAAIRYVAPDAAACKVASTAVVQLTIGEDGAPQDVKAEKYESALAVAAAKAVQAWQFEPGSVNGTAFGSKGTLEFVCRPPGELEAVAPDSSPAYRVGGGVKAPVLLWKSEPYYSEEARKAKHQGTTMLYVQISPEGKATNIHVIRRLGLGLDQKAIEAVKHWRFQPGMRGDEPVTVEATIEVNFRLL